MSKEAKFRKTSYREALKKELEAAPKPKLSEVAANFIRLAGGPQQFAKHLWDEYNAADDGSLARQRIMALVVQCLKQDEEVFDPASLDEMEDQDLENLFKHLNKTVESIDAEDPAHSDQGGQAGPEATEGQSLGDGKGQKTGGVPAAAEGADEDWPSPPSQKAVP